MFLRNEVKLKYQDEFKQHGPIELSNKKSYAANLPLPKGTRRLQNGEIVADFGKQSDSNTEK